MRCAHARPTPRRFQQSRTTSSPPSEARALADGNPPSFLRVSRAEIELPPSTNPYSGEVYERAQQNFARLKERSLVLEAEPSLYLYRLRMGPHEQTGLAACFSLDEYDRDVIKKHERTRRRQGRRPHAAHDRARRADGAGVSHLPRVGRRRRDRGPGRRPGTALRLRRRRTACVTRSGGRRAPDLPALVAAFGRIPALYIADGHHRAASAARARDARERTTACGSATAPTSTPFLPSLFLTTRSRSFRTTASCRTSAALSPASFIEAVRERFIVAAGPPSPARRGDIAMYFQNEWRTLRPRVPPDPADAIGSLDVSVLQDALLAPILGIADVRTDKRIDFVGGARGTAELQRSGRLRPGRGRLLAVPGQRRRSHGRLRRGRDHAAEEHVVRAEAARWPADSRHLRCSSDSRCKPDTRTPDSKALERRVRARSRRRVACGPHVSESALNERRRVKVLVADKFEQSGHRRPEGGRLRRVVSARSEGRGARGCDPRQRRRGAGRPRHAGHRGDARSGALSLVVRAGAGYNTIDVAAASRRGIYVSNCPGQERDCGRRADVRADARARPPRARQRRGAARRHGGTRRSISKARGLFGRTLGLLGYGSIGQEVARRAHGVRHAGRRLEPPVLPAATATGRPAMPFRVVDSPRAARRASRRASASIWR